MYEYFRFVLEIPQTVQVVTTAVVVVAVLVLRWVLLRTITQAKIKSADLRRRWMVQIRGVSFFLITLGLVAIWAPQLRTAALSVVAVLAALVVATKELLLCLSGGFLKMTSGSFSLGDRIMVKGIRGDVIDQTLLTTTVLEIGPGLNIHQGTSRAVTLPNSLFLSEPVFNESFTKPYVLHTFTVPIKAAGDWRAAEAKLLAAAKAVCKPILDDARRHIAHLTKREAFDTPSVDPRVMLSLPDPDRVDLVVRVPAPADHKGRTEQEILRRYLDAAKDSYAGAPAPSP